MNNLLRKHSDVIRNIIKHCRIIGPLLLVNKLWNELACEDPMVPFWKRFWYDCKKYRQYPYNYASNIASTYDSSADYVAAYWFDINYSCFAKYYTIGMDIAIDKYCKMLYIMYFDRIVTLYGFIGPDFIEIAKRAIRRSRTDILEYLISTNKIDVANIDLLDYIVYWGNVNVLTYFRAGINEHNHYQLSACSARHGNIDYLKYIFKCLYDVELSQDMISILLYYSPNRRADAGVSEQFYRIYRELINHRPIY